MYTMIENVREMQKDLLTIVATLLQKQRSKNYGYTIKSND